MKFKGEILVVLASVCFSLMPVFAKTAYRGGANVTTVLLFRFAFALIFIWAYIFIKGFKFKVKPKEMLMLALLGAVFYSGSAIALFNAYRFISAGLSEVLMFTYPAWVLIISFVFFREKLEKNKIYAIVLSIIGIAAVTYAPNQKFSFIGVVLTLVAAITYALYVIFIEHGGLEEIHSVVMTGYILLFATLAYVIFGFSTGEISLNFNKTAWIPITLLAFLSTSVPIFAFCTATKLIGSSRAAIVSNIEPITTFICGYVFLNEKITFNMIIGGAIVIMAIISIHVFESSSNLNSEEISA